MKRHIQTNVVAAVLFAGIGAIVLLASRDYQIGTTMRMGPGYLPTALSALLILLSVILAFQHPDETEEGAIEAWHVGPIAAVLASMVAFALLIDPLGLIGATVGLVIVSRLATRPYRIPEVAAFALLGALFSAAVFVWLLRLPIDLWPR